MGMYDDIEILQDIENGPFSGSYQTRDLENILANYVLQGKRLYAKLIKYEVIPEEERKHPIFGLLRAKFLGLKDMNYHGYIEIYNANETWKLKFTDGELVESIMIEFHPDDPDDTTEPNDNDKDCDGDNSYWQGDEQQYAYNPEDYEDNK